jgi:phosphate transport system substrate-binding protein
MMAIRSFRFFLGAVLAFLFSACDNYFRNDYKDNSPTSGKLRVYYDEGLHLHVKNQVYTFESQYEAAKVDLVQATENEAVQALFDDSCETIFISRLLNEREKKVFASRQFNPKFSPVAKSGIAIICSANAPYTGFSLSELHSILTSGAIKDSSGKLSGGAILFDRSNSAVLHYMKDSVLRGEGLSPKCVAAKSTVDCIEYVSAHPGSLGFIDFAWLSDRDDSLYKRWVGAIRFLGVKVNGLLEYPSQSSFKTGTYPLTRTVYVMRKTGDFTLAKGFESFVAGPKGQLTFLKQGLLPARQAERSVTINLEPMATE